MSESCPCKTDPGSNMPTSFGSVISGGIQDISALLPLLGTEQCEKHVGSSLNDGFLYAAVTPLSIFGCLGAAKAAFAIGLASIPFHRLLGAKRFKAAGFAPKGAVTSMITLDRQRYVAESQFLKLLQDRHINNVEKLSIKLNNGPERVLFSISKHRLILPPWNVSIVISSLLVTVLSFIPYLHFIIRRDTSTLLLAWLFPLIRGIGKVLCVVPSQYILQNRIVWILNQRILFMRINKHMERMEQSNGVPRPDQWTDQVTSEECLWDLHGYLRNNKHANLDLANCIMKACDNIRNTSSSYLRHPLLSDIPEFKKIAAKNLEDLMSKHSCFVFPWIPWFTWHIMIIIGIVASVVGYIGCFTLVQDNRSTTAGRYIWLGLEVTLSLLRTLVWASNPGVDDSGGLKLELQLSKDQPFANDDELRPPAINLIETGGSFRVVEEDHFLSEIEPYSGPIIPFKKDNDAKLYYRLGTKTVYVMFCSNGPRHGTLFPANNRDDLYLANLRSDWRTGARRVTLDELPKDHNSRGDHSLIQQLSTHGSEIFERLENRRDVWSINLDWLLTASHAASTSSWSDGKSIDLSPPQDSKVTWDSVMQGIKDIMSNHRINNFEHNLESVVLSLSLVMDGRHMYNELKEYFSSYLDQCMTNAGVVKDGELLGYYVTKWEMYSNGVEHVDHIFTGLNEHWVKDERDRGNKYVYPVKTLAFAQWEKHFLDPICDRLNLKEHALGFSQDNRSLVKQIIISFVALRSGALGDGPNAKFDVYNTCFEANFKLETTSLIWFFRQVLNFDQDEDLRHMYSLLSRLDTGPASLNQWFEEFIEKAASGAVLKTTEKGASSFGGPDTNAYATALRDVFRRNSAKVRTHFGNDPKLLETLMKVISNPPEVCDAKLSSELKPILDQLRANDFHWRRQRQ